MICTTCNTNKDKSNFYYRKDSKKYRKECKQCISLKRKEYYNNNAAHIKDKDTHYRKKNRNKIIERAREYNNRQDVKDRNKKYRQKNKAKLRKKEKEWRLNNPEKYKAICRRKNRKQRQKPKNKLKKSHIQAS